MTWKRGQSGNPRGNSHAFIGGLTPLPEQRSRVIDPVLRDLMMNGPKVDKPFKKMIRLVLKVRPAVGKQDAKKIQRLWNEVQPPPPPEELELL